MDEGRDASLIGKDQVARLINATVRGGFPRTRPYVKAIPLIFTDEEQRSWFETEIYQGCFFYSFVAVPNAAVSTNNPGLLVEMVGGRLFTVDPDTGRVIEITPNEGRSSRLINLGYMTQAEQWLVVQDGQSAAALWDGSNARRAVTGEVPVGRRMAYGQGRLFVEVGNQIMGGDIVGGPGGQNAVINFRERLELAIKGDISPSFVIGNTTFLEFIPQQDTTTGVGTLLVGGEKGVTSISAEKPRDQWAQGISRVVLFNVGGTGHRSPAQINGDVWWRSNLGMRSYRQARAEIKNLAQLPLSTELDPFFLSDTPALLPWVSSVYFDNRLLTTINPRTQNGRVYFKGIGVCDFHILSSFGDEVTKPAWDGIWTGYNFSELKLGAGRCFAPGIDRLGRNCLFEVLADNEAAVADREIDGALRPVECQLISGAYVGQGAGNDVVKKLAGGKFSVRRIRESVEVEVAYRKDGEQCFQFWDTFSFCAKTTLCSLDAEASPCGNQIANPQYRTPIILRQPNALENISNDPPEGAGSGAKPMVNGYEFQARFKWTGHCQLRAFQMEFNKGFEKVTSGCTPPDTCTASTVCCDDPFEFTPKLPQYTIPINPPDPTAGIIAAQIAIINFLGVGLLTPVNEVIAGIPLPTDDVNQAILNLINNGTIVHPSAPPGPGVPGGYIRVPVPIRII